MKKIILLLALCSLSLGNLFAQKFHFGLGVTPSLAWLHPGSDELTGDGSKIGFNYGLITEFGITENYAFATGITVDSKGGKLKSKTEVPFVIPPDTTLMSAVENFDYTIRYVEVPLTLKMKTNAIGYIRYYGQFGLAPGFLIGAKGTEKLGSYTPVDNVDIKDNVNNFNVSLVIALGIEYNLSGNTNLLLGILYKNGFSDVLNQEGKANANSLGLNVGILF
ncbi:MAG: porin family protein [Bacteroidia bacterium]